MDLSDFKYESKYVDINGSNIHYVEDGEGDAMVFVHGIPTWSYLWRNIIPHLKGQAHCVALDLIGCGYSDKPQLDYTIDEHIEYFTAFIEALNLNKITLVVHGWGSVIGLAYAMQNPEKIKGLVLIESHLRLPTQREMLSLPVQEVVNFLHQKNAEQVILNSNYYVEKVLQSGVMRRLEAEELAHYLIPYEKDGTRQPIWQYLQELPTGDNQTAASKVIETYSPALVESDIPKLLLYTVPGFITTIETVKWAKDNMKNISVVDIGEALHYPQETLPQIISEEIRNWYQALK